MRVSDCQRFKTGLTCLTIISGRERVVILGSGTGTCFVSPGRVTDEIIGWAGYPLLWSLDHTKFQVVMVSPRSYFVFTPLLASTAVGTLEVRTALEPIRTRRNKAEFIQGWANSVDLYNKRIAIEEAVVDPEQGLANTTCRNEGKNEHQLKEEHAEKMLKGQLFDLSYDKLVIGVGCYTQTFGIPGVKENAFFLKEPGDARNIRKKLLECFEVAGLPTTPDEIRKMILSFAIVGGASRSRYCRFYNPLTSHAQEVPQALSSQQSFLISSKKTFRNCIPTSSNSAR